MIPSKPADAPAVKPVAALSDLPKGAVETVPEGDRILHVSPSDIVANPYQPRREFHPEELEELVATVKEFGILQPLVVTEKANGMFELIAGERRLRAAVIAGLGMVPAVVRETDEGERLAEEVAAAVEGAELAATV